MPHPTVENFTSDLIKTLQKLQITARCNNAFFISRDHSFDLINDNSSFVITMEMLVIENTHKIPTNFIQIFLE